MKIAYLDCFAGASGDMILGALLDAGLELDRLKAELGKLSFGEYELGVKKVSKRGIGGSQLQIAFPEQADSSAGHDHDHDHAHGHHHDHHHEHDHDHGHDHHHDHDHAQGHDHHHDNGHHHSHDHHHDHGPGPHSHAGHRNLPEIWGIISQSELAEDVKEKSLAVFQRLAEAEAKVHQVHIDKVHFHEVGAMDTIIDVVGAVAGFAALGIERIFCSPLHVGSGTVVCAHGTLPVPAPATAELLKNKPIYSTGVRGELVTPTGAAILTTLASGFGPMPSMTLQSIGYGAGTSDPDIPNLLRLSIGQAAEKLPAYDLDRAAVIQTNIDDMNPQIYDHLFELLLGAGALDVFLTPVHMKKNRPGTLLTVTCPPEIVGNITDLILHETTSIGLRWRVENRFKAHRVIRSLDTQYGALKIKVAENGKGVINVSPEYEDCRRLALEKKVPLKEVMAQAVAASRQALK